MAKKSAPPATPALSPAQQRQAAENARVRNAPVNKPRAASPAENVKKAGVSVKDLLGLGAIGRAVDTASKKR